MDDIALVGGPYLGKTTLARVLRDQYGYAIADHSLTLTRRYCRSYVASTGRHITPELVYADKPAHREGLIQFSHLINYNSDLLAVDESLDAADPLREKPIVFDNARSLDQIAYLYHQDFLVVVLTLDKHERARRAAAQGCSEVRLLAAIRAESAQGLGGELATAAGYVDYVLDMNKTPEGAAAEVVQVARRRRHR